MPDNARVADAFDELAELLELQGESVFRIRGYRGGARAIRDLPEPVESLARNDPDRLPTLTGIGESLAQKIVELVTTGRLQALEDARAAVPAGVVTLMRVPRLGPKKAVLLHRELGITTLDDLKRACESHQVSALKGFGKKTEQEILKGIALAETVTERLRWDMVESLVRDVRTHLEATPGLKRLEFAGSYRRGAETVGDLDILVTAQSPDAAMDRLATFPGVADLIGRGETKMSARLAQGFQVDLRVVPDESFGAALQYFTGSRDHNIRLRQLAIKKQIKINEYGVFKLTAEDAKPADQTTEEPASGTRIGGAEEADVYQAVGLPWFPPEIREARFEFDWAARGDLPTLVTTSDLVGDLHTHTDATDGEATLAEMADAAIALGHQYLAITDHSRRVTVARGLDPERLLAQGEAIDALNKKLNGTIRLLKGIECDILEKGGLDLPDEVLATLDWVIVSVHFGQRQSKDQITGRIVDALAHPSVDVLAHPTGRLIGIRPSYEVDLDAVFRAAVDNNKFLEINCGPERRDLSDVHARAAASHGVPLVISTDAHSIRGLHTLRYGILNARRAGLTAEQIVNTRSWTEIQAMKRR